MRKLLLSTAIGSLALMGTAYADDAAPTTTEVKFMIDNLWILISAAFVFIMHLGFATLESGLTRSKNTVNILFKNMMDVCIGTITVY